MEIIVAFFTFFCLALFSFSLTQYGDWLNKKEISPIVFFYLMSIPIICFTFAMIAILEFIIERLI